MNIPNLRVLFSQLIENKIWAVRRYLLKRYPHPIVVKHKEKALKFIPVMTEKIIIVNPNKLHAKNNYQIKTIPQSLEPNDTSRQIHWSKKRS